MVGVRIPKLYRDSASFALAILTVCETFLALSGISLYSLIPNQKWWVLLIVIIVVYAIVFTITVIVQKMLSMRGMKILINGNTVKIEQGDLFTFRGCKVIPFNEYFDTMVDNIVVSEKSLNGQFILNHVADVDDLIGVIDKDARSYAKEADNCEKQKFPLGHSIVYQSEYILLALTHFTEQNVAHLNMVDYMCCLMNMWKEIRRLYANRPVALPLVGSGITSFDDDPNKPNFDLLKCMLYTLKVSEQYINQPITIFLTNDVMREIKLYELKGAI